MALKPGPKGAIPTTRGWVHPRTGELLKSQRITQEQLDEYNGVQMIAEPAPVVEEASFASTLHCHRSYQCSSKCTIISIGYV